MAASPIRAPQLLKSVAMPVDRAVFAGIPSVTALERLPPAHVLLAAPMDRRLVACALAAAAPPAAGGKPARISCAHLTGAHDNWVHDLDVHPDGVRFATGGTDRRIKLWKWGQEQPLAE